MKCCFVVIDYQLDFLASFSQAKALKAPILAYLDSFKGDIIFLKDKHDNDYPLLYESLLYPPHCQGNGAFMPAEFEGKEAKIFYKNSFASLDFASYLASQKYAQVEFGGLLGEVCVLANAILARSVLPKAKIILKEDLIFFSCLKAATKLICSKQSIDFVK